eukprot:jgi/Galph1/5433/GphlegSOOS_G4050.1
MESLRVYPVLFIIVTFFLLGLTEGTPNLRVAALGDSVASGEGTLYGLSYNSFYMTSPNYAIQYLRTLWHGPTDLHPQWLGPYPECHRSPFASVFQLPLYVDRNKASVEVSNFACTGGSIHRGLLGPQLSKNATVSQMEQLINSWKSLNWSDNDIPIVVLSFGADDGSITPLNEIADIVKKQLESYLASILIDSVIYQLAKYPCLAQNVSISEVLSALQQLNSSSTTTNGTRVFTATEYASAIQYLRGNITNAIQKTPYIIVQTYYSPLNPNNEADLLQCPDMAGLKKGNSLIADIHNVLDKLESDVLTAANRTSSFVNNITDLMKDHEYCSGHPEWAYGPVVSLEEDIEAIFAEVPVLSFLGPVAPLGNYGVSAFHPVPSAQSKIAEYLWHTIDRDILQSSTSS